MSEGVGTTPGTRVVDGRQVPEVGTWEIDPSHQSFEFVARHLMHKVRGRFPAASGVATIAERPEDSTLEIEIDANSIDTKDDTRDAHMRSNASSASRTTRRSASAAPGSDPATARTSGRSTATSPSRAPPAR